MKPSRSILLLLLVLFTFFSLIAGEFFFDLRALAQKTSINKDGSQTTSEPDNTYGEGGTKETVRDRSGRTIKVVKKDKDKKPRSAVTYLFPGNKECRYEETWIYDSRGRLVSFLVEWVNNPCAKKENGKVRRTIKYSDDGDTTGTQTDQGYDSDTGEWKPASESDGPIIDSGLKPDPDHDYSPDKPESIIGDLQVKPTASPSPSPSTEHSPKFKLDLKYNFKFSTSPGLNTETFTLPSGSKISVNFPDDLSAGDTFTGTVRTEVAGKDEQQRARNQSELNKTVLVIGGQPTPATGKMFTRTIPANINSGLFPMPCTLRDCPYLVLMVNEKQVGGATVPIAQNTPPTPQNAQLPECGQMGQNLVIKDHCDGVLAPTDTVTIAGTVIQPLAESPRMRVLENTCNTPGPTQISYTEQGKQTSGPFQNFGVELSADHLNLRTGQETKLRVTARGLKGIQRDATLDIANQSASIVNMEGGNAQHFVIHPADVAADGTYKIERTLTGIQQGAFEITATVMCTPLAPTPTPTPTPSPRSAGAHPSPSPTPSPGASPCCPISPGTYAVTFLGTLPPPGPANVSIAVGINDSEDTVGGSYNVKFTGAPHAFSIYPADAPLVAKDDLGWPPDKSPYGTGGVGAFAYGVNASGHVAGIWFIPPAPLAFTYPFWFDGSKMHKLPEPGFPSGSGYAYALNIHDDVVGIIYSGKSGSPLLGGHAVIWPHDGHPMVDLNTLLPKGSGWELKAAYGINDAGHVVGKGVLKGATHAFLWKGSGDAVDLGTLPGGGLSVAFGLNSSDEVVGYSTSTKPGFHGFVWKVGMMTDIGTLPPYTDSFAQTINEKGCVVGDMFLGEHKPIFEGGDFGAKSHAVLYTGSLIDLNTLIPADSGWELKTANDINDKCQVVGAGYYKGSKYLTAYVLTPPGVALTGSPKPTPATASAGACPIAVGSGDYVFNNWNICGVKNGPTKDTTFTIGAPYLITFIATYHWNYGKGALSTKGISLKDSSGKVFGPWPLTTSAGSGGAANVNWECHPGITLPAGTYTVIDPDPATWSQNDGSGNVGFARVAGSAIKK